MRYVASVWRSRGMVAAALGAVAAEGIALVAYPFMPVTVVKHGSFVRPDEWTTRGNWLIFQLAFPAAVTAFVMLVVVAATAMGPSGLHLRDPAQQTYWTKPEHWPAAGHHLINLTGEFMGMFAVGIAVTLVVAGAGHAWGIPYVLTWAVPLVVLAALTVWFTRQVSRVFRVPGA